MSGASPNAGGDSPSGGFKGQVGLADGVTLRETVPAIGGKAIYGQTDNHDDDVHHYEPVGEVGTPGRREGVREGVREGGGREGGTTLNCTWRLLELGPLFKLSLLTTNKLVL